MKRILLVEDDAGIKTVVIGQLKREAYNIEHTESGNQALDLISADNFALLILDWMLPDLSGLEICEKVREQGISTPIMMLTGRADPIDKAKALDAGADDYVVKPFSKIEFQARVRALIRRDQKKYKNITYGDLELDLEKQIVYFNNEEIPFLPKEYEIVELLIKHPEKYFSAEAIFSRAWSNSSDTTLDTVRSHIREVRKKLRQVGIEDYLENMRGRGYRIKHD